jgi:hypothetical protein
MEMDMDMECKQCGGDGTVRGDVYCRLCLDEFRDGITPDPRAASCGRAGILAVPGVGEHRVGVHADAAALMFVGDRCIGVSECWSGYQGSNNNPPGSRYLLIRDGQLVPVKREEVPPSAEHVYRDCLSGRTFRQKVRR